MFLCILLLSGPLLGMLFVCINALQAVGAARDSLLLSLCRQEFIFLPCLIARGLSQRMMRKKFG